MNKKLTAMEKAALALLSAGCVETGTDDERYAFAGRFDEGCFELRAAQLAKTHPKGLQTSAWVAPTLSASGRATAQACFCLTAKGKQYAEELRAREGSHRSETYATGEAP